MSEEEKTLERLLAKGFPVPWGRYELQYLVGKGSSAWVFAGELIGPAGFRKRVAIKVVRRVGSSHTDGILDEARLGARLKHRNLVETYDVGIEQGHVYVAMELVEGPRLRDLMRQDDGISPRATVEVLIQVAHALHHVHNQSIDGQPLQAVHRDIKPTNILISRSGEVKVADFGVASAEALVDPQRSRDIAGTPGYMAPEVVLGQPTDSRADLFSVGIVLCECLLGRRPFNTRPYPAYVESMRDFEATLAESGVLADLSTTAPYAQPIVAHCLTATPQTRTPSAAQLIDELGQVLPRSKGNGLVDLLGLDENSLPTAEPSSNQTDHSTNLESDVDLFVGRDTDLQQIIRHLKQGTRLVTLQGPGGIGKTRLARQVGFAMRPHFPVWFIDVANATTPDGWVTCMADTFRTEPTDHAVSAHIRRMSQALLILDNLEQIVDVAATEINKWLGANPSLTIVATTRVRLNLAGETTLVVGPLDLEAACRLFVSRARSLSPNFEADQSELASLVQLLDGHPLALELAATHARLMSLPAIVARMESGIDALGHARHRGPDRHGSLRAAIDGSWDLLQPWEKAAFAQLSVFRGGFTMDAASAVVDLSPWPDAPWLVFVVESLLDQSLVHPLPEPAPDGSPRFGLLLSLQAYAGEKLLQLGSILDGMTGDEAVSAAKQRHVDHFRGLVDAVHDDLMADRDGRQIRRMVSQEIGNIEDAFQYVLKKGRLGDAYQLMLFIRSLTEHRGPYELGLRLSLDYLTAAEGHPRPMSLAHDCAGIMQMHLGNTRAAKDHYQQALTLAEESGVRRSIIRAQCNLGLCLLQDGKSGHAMSRFQQAIAMAMSDGQELAQGINLLNLGTALLNLNKLADAQGAFEQANALHHRLHAPLREAMGLGYQAVTDCMMGNREAETRHWTRAQGLLEESGSLMHQAEVCLRMGMGRIAQGRYGEAQAPLARGLTAAQTLKNPQLEHEAQCLLAMVEARTGRIESATKRLEALTTGHRGLPHPALAELGARIAIAETSQDPTTLSRLSDERAKWAARYPQPETWQLVLLEQKH